MKLKGIIVSGYFNPLHKGHIELFSKAKDLGQYLFVIINNDVQRSLKESKEFMLEDERLLIVDSLKITDKVILSIDEDRTVCKTLKKIHDQFADRFHLSFANGGDQSINVIPEKKICDTLGINLIDGLGDKVQSSSWLLKNKK
jgi:cytidyltransferase-like protein